MRLPIRSNKHRLVSLRTLSSLSSHCLPHQGPNDPSTSREQSLLALFPSCSSMRDLTQLHAQIIRTGFDQNVYVAGRIISFCSVSGNGSVHHARSVFDHLTHPDAFLFNTIIRGFGRTNNSADAFLFYHRMRRYGKLPDNFTFSFLLKIASQTPAIELGKQLHGAAITIGLDTHIFVRNTLIHMYGQFEDMISARYLFDEIPNKDLVSFNTLIDGYAHCSNYKQALRTYDMMRDWGFHPDEATFVVVLSSCAEIGELEFGSRVHSAISRDILDQNTSVSNSLIDMYAKCGEIERAVGVFEEMRVRDVVSWNCVILGLAVHGHSAAAMKLYDRMREEEFEDPNDITFLGVLSACSHGGLVEQGRRYFDSMQKDYCITPSIKHYGCMVDLLGRAGLVKEAYELVRSMPMEGNAVVWRTLLGACREHGDLELGEYVRQHIGELELEPDHSSDYVLLSHMYASAGQWNDVLQMREAMRGRGVQKPKPGNSLAGTLANAA